MAIGLSGMISGLDTESIVKALVSAQRTKSTKIENKITMNKWTTEAWSDLNKKIYSFYTKHASKLRLASSYMTKSATSADESFLKATAGSTAAIGTHAVKVKSLASSQYVTGGKINGNGDIYSSKSKLSYMGGGVAAGTVITVKSKLGTADEKVAKLQVDENTTVDDFLKFLKSSGLTATFDTAQQRFFISSSDSGVENKFSISAGTVSTGAETVFSAIESGINTSELTEAKKTEFENAMTTLRQNADYITTVLDDQTYDSSNETHKKVKKAIESVIGISQEQEAGDMAEDNVKAAMASAISEGAANGTYTLFGETYNYSDVYNETYNTLVAEANGDEDAIAAIDTAAVEARMLTDAATAHQTEYDSDVADEKAIILENKDTNELATLKTYIETNLATAGNAGIDTSGTGLSNLGLGEITGVAQRTQDANGNSVGMVVVAAANAVVDIDGTTFDEASNTFSINGLTLDLKKTTYNETTSDYDTINVTVNKDTDKTYDLIKEAIKEYNELMEEMYKKYSADSARDYKPLTDEQKEAMSDTEVENWENKIKDSLLRRDETLGSLMTSMRQALSKSYKASDGQEYTLSSFGITTGAYTERGKLHIYGDPDDTAYATAEDRLKAALSDNPEKVQEVLSGIFSNLYSTMTEKCAKTEISSALTFYNDKQYAKYLSSYEKDLDKMEDRIKDMEDRYYKQFTAMEKALANLQSQTSALQGMLGMNTQ